MIGEGQFSLDGFWMASSNGENAYSLVRTRPPMTSSQSSPEPDLTIREAQETVDRWISTIGVRYFSELTNLAQLMEEVGELSRIMSRTYGEQSFKDSETESGLEDELADVLFVLICIANQTGVDLTAALGKNLEKKTQRDLNRHRENPKLQ
ncbi:MAG: NTP pyrophosphatase (non-canonical NTP hydrolase) [Mariniblastus sp.]|jgi:NTP pyrophosphatase (non-canonical NTP hydrolase)